MGGNESLLKFWLSRKIITIKKYLLNKSKHKLTYQSLNLFCNQTEFSIIGAFFKTKISYCRKLILIFLPVRLQHVGSAAVDSTAVGSAATVGSVAVGSAAVGSAAVDSAPVVPLLLALPPLTLLPLSLLLFALLLLALLLLALLHFFALLLFAPLPLTLLLCCR